MVYKRNKTQKYIKVAINHKALPYYKEAKRLYFKNYHLLSIDGHPKITWCIPEKIKINITSNSDKT